MVNITHNARIPVGLMSGSMDLAMPPQTPAITLFLVFFKLMAFILYKDHVFFEVLLNFQELFLTTRYQLLFQ